jgi:hypothetical protein
MKNTILKVGAAFVVAIAVFVIALPTIMHKAGLRRVNTRSRGLMWPAPMA